MSTSVDNAFIKDYQSDVHVEYQRMGTLLRESVRTKNNITGYSTTFQKVGKGVASTKTRHGLVPVMNVDHTPVECILADHYAGDWCDKLDELKININEREVTVKAGAYALGRKTDEMIINALDSATNTTSKNLSAITAAELTAWTTRLFARDVPAQDGQVWGVVSWQLWGKMLGITEFTNADYVGGEGQQFRTGIRPKSWLGVNWMPHSGLKIATNARKNYIYHRTAIGHAIGEEITSDITWHGDHAAHFINNMMSQGSVLIDDDGVEELIVTENA